MFVCNLFLFYSFIWKSFFCNTNQFTLITFRKSRVNEKYSLWKKQLNVSFMGWFNIPDFLLNFQNWLQNPQKVIRKMINQKIFVCNMDWRKQNELHSVRVADNKNHWVHFIIKEYMYVHVCIYLSLKKISCFLLGNLGMTIRHCNE